MLSYQLQHLPLLVCKGYFFWSKRRLETTEPILDSTFSIVDEQRISNFLLWQIAYAELYFTDILWPDFKKEDLYEALINYQNRERRFGKTSEQLT